MKRRLRIRSAVLLSGSMVVLTAMLLAEPPIAVVALAGGGLVIMSLADAWMVSQYLIVRRDLVEVVRGCGMRHGGSERADHFEGLVPADVLAEAFPTPSPSPAEGGHRSNHTEASDD